jgi:segregation and condensation protein B
MRKIYDYFTNFASIFKVFHLIASKGGPMSLMTVEKLQSILEAAIMIAGHPLNVAALQQLFPEDERPAAADIKTALAQVAARHENTGISLVEVASGYRFQAKGELSPWLSRLFEERAPRYSRAFLETLALIAYKQPITRAEIEEIRGVTVSTNIMKTLQERDWVRCVGLREVPGKPSLYGTTKVFLDHFNLKSLSELPTLAEFKDMEPEDDTLRVQLAMEASDLGPENSELIPMEREAHTEEETTPLELVSTFTEETTPTVDDTNVTLNPEADVVEDISLSDAEAALIPA